MATVHFANYSHFYCSLSKVSQALNWKGGLCVTKCYDQSGFLRCSVLPEISLLRAPMWRVPAISWERHFALSKHHSIMRLFYCIFGVFRFILYFWYFDFFFLQLLPHLLHTYPITISALWLWDQEAEMVHLNFEVWLLRLSYGWKIKKFELGLPWWNHYTSTTCWKLYSEINNLNRRKNLFMKVDLFQPLYGTCVRMYALC